MPKQKIYIHTLRLSGVEDPLRQSHALWNTGHEGKGIVEHASKKSHFRLFQALKSWQADVLGERHGFFGLRKTVRYIYTDVLIWVPKHHWERYTHQERYVFCDNLTRFYSGSIAREERLNQRDPSFIAIPMTADLLLGDQVLFQFGHGIYIPQESQEETRERNLSADQHHDINPQEGEEREEDGELYLAPDEIRPSRRSPDGSSDGAGHGFKPFKKMVDWVCGENAADSPMRSQQDDPGPTHTRQEIPRFTVSLLTPRAVLLGTQPWYRYTENKMVEIPTGIYPGQTCMVLSGDPTQSSVQIRLKYGDQRYWFSGNQGSIVLSMDHDTNVMSAQGDSDHDVHVELARASDQEIKFCCHNGRDEFLAILLRNPASSSEYDVRMDDEDNEITTGVVYGSTYAGHWLEFAGCFLPPIVGYPLLDSMHMNREKHVQYTLFLDERGIPIQRQKGAFETLPPGAVMALLTTSEGIFYKKIHEHDFQMLNIDTDLKDSCNTMVATFAPSPLKPYLGLLRFSESSFKPLTTEGPQILGRRRGVDLMDPFRVVALELLDFASFHWENPPPTSVSLGNLELSRDHLVLSCNDHDGLTIRLYKGERNPRHPCYYLGSDLKLKETLQPGEETSITLVSGEWFMVGLYLFRYIHKRG